VYVEYTDRLHRHIEESGEPRRGRRYRRVREVYRKDLGLAWTEPLGFDNTFAIAMKPEVAAKLGIRKFSDLRAHQTSLRPGMGHEFLEREDGFRGLVEASLFE
jgi:osmoprotectant transport system substrate-binding protein